MTWLIDLILGPVGAALGGLLTLAAVFFAGKSNQKKANKIDDLENEVEAHDRINRAKTGDALDDDERLKRLSRIGRGEWNGG